jgi:Pyridoxamine 5'-phosphate oxidase
MATIPKVLHEHINTAFPGNVCLVATVLPNGFAQVSPRGSTMVFDDDHLALWERGKGSTNANLKDGTKVTVFMRKPPLRDSGVLPKGGIARFYGTAAGADWCSRRRSATRTRRASACSSRSSGPRTWTGSRWI